MSTRGISVKILGKDYQVACPEGEEPALVDAAYFLDRKMAEIRNSGRVFGVERIAVMAALNLAHELLFKEKNFTATEQEVNSRISHISNKIEAAITAAPSYSRPKTADPTDTTLDYNEQS